MESFGGVSFLIFLFSCRREGQVRLDYMPPPKELEKALAAKFIMTMASSPPDQQVIKMFLYAQHVSSSSASVLVGVAGGCGL